MAYRDQANSDGTDDCKAQGCPESSRPGRKFFHQQRFELPWPRSYLGNVPKSTGQGTPLVRPNDRLVLSRRQSRPSEKETMDRELEGQSGPGIVVTGGPS
jgi:hypothetical protein